MNQRVYVMECDGFVKIGVSGNVERRAKQIPYKVRRIYASEFLSNPFDIERKMHRHYCNHRKHTPNGREYFEIPFYEACKKLNELLSVEQKESRPCTFKGFDDVLIEQHPEIKRIGLDAYIVERVIKGFSSLSDFDKGYFLAKVESLADEAEKKPDAPAKKT